MRVDTIDDEAGFDALEDEWGALLASSAQDSPFLRFKWQRAWWDAIGSGAVTGDRARLHVLACRDAGELVGVLPLFIARAGRMAPARAARLLADSDVGSVGLGAIAHASVEGPVMERLLAELLEGPRRWDVLDLRYVDPQGGFFRLVGEGAARGAGQRVSDSCDVCPRARLATDWDGYLATLTKHFRGNVRRSMRRVGERGIEFELVRDACDLPAAIDDFHRLHESRMREKLGDDYCVSPACRIFASRAMHDLFDDGALRLSFMRRGDERLVAIYQLRHGDTMYSVQSGFVPEGRLDAQQALWGHAIESAIGEGCTTLDMLLGDQAYKRDWGATDVRAFSRVRLYNRTVPGLVRKSRDGAVERLAKRREAAAATA